MLRKVKEMDKTWREGLQSHHKDYILNTLGNQGMFKLKMCALRKDIL